MGTLPVLNARNCNGRGRYGYGNVRWITSSCTGAHVSAV